MASSYDRFRAATESDSDQDDDIDDLGDCKGSATPLLPTACDEYDQAEGDGIDAAHSGHLESQEWSSVWFDPKKVGGGIQRLFTRQRRKRGLCPICGEQIRSGAHQCSQAQWKIREGQLADAVRCDGNAHFRACRYEDAVAAYSKALAHSPEDARLWSNRSAANALLGRETEALEDAESSIRIAPSWAKGHLRKARVLQSRQDQGSLIHCYEVALQACTKPEDQVSLRRRLSAARTRHEAIRLVRDLPSAYSVHAIEERWLRQRGERNGLCATVSEQDLNCIKEAEQAKADGNHEVSKQRFEDADRCYVRGLKWLSSCSAPSIKHAQLEAALLLNKSLCDARAGRHTEAAERCAEVLELDPMNVKARFRRASALSDAQDYEAALEELEIALVLQPSEATVAALRRNVRQKRAALKHREKEQYSRMLRGAAPA